MRRQMTMVGALFGGLLWMGALLGGCSGGQTSTAGAVFSRPSRAPTALSTPAAQLTDAPAPRPSRTARPTHAPTHTSRPNVTTGEAVVTEIVDGDTIRVRIGGQVYTVRYIGIDTLETHDSAPHIRELAKAATAANRALVGGKTVWLEKDVSETDRYGRLLRYVYVGDVMVNAELVRLGHAIARQYPPDTRYHALFEQLEAPAKAAGTGIWAPLRPVTRAAASLRAGPDVTYDEVRTIRRGEPVEIVARNAAGDWYQLAGGAWILAQYVEDAPARAMIPVAAPPNR